MDFNHSIPNNISVTEFITRRFDGHETKTAMIEGATGKEWTYGQFRRYVQNIGSAFARLGLKKGDVVAFIVPNGLEHIASIFAIVATGGIASGMNPIYTKDEIKRQLQDCTASYVITCPEVLPKVLAAVPMCPHVKEIFLIGKKDSYTTIREMCADDGSYFPNIEFDAANDLAFLPYSSGTTGLPKGVMITHRALMTQIYLVLQYKSFAFFPEETRALTMFPFYHIGGFSFCGVSLYQRCPSVLIQTFDFEAFLKLIEKHKTEALFLPPPVILRMAKDPLVNKYDMSSIKKIIGGGAPISATLQKVLCRRLNVDDIRQAYGMTETCGATHVSKMDSPPAYGSAGTCHPMIPCKIMDIETGKELTGPRKTGEVWVKTPCRMEGYWRCPENTRDTLDKDGWIHTGDIAYLDENDNIYIVDRLKELIKYKGFQVAPAELEALLLSHPYIVDAAVIGIPDERAGEVPAAYVVLKEGRKLDVSQIAKYVAEHAAPYKHLRGGVHFMDAIPKSLSGKILRRVLRDNVLKQLKIKSNI